MKNCNVLLSESGPRAAYCGQRLKVSNEFQKNPVERMDTGLLTEGNGLAQHNCIIMQNDFQTFKRSLLK